jgi:DNA-binding NtrC family response regulator
VEQDEPTGDRRGVEEAAAMSGAERARATLLLVDDDEDMCRFLGELVGDLGADAVLETDPVAALERFAPGRFDVVVTDVRMARLDGIELIRKIRQRDADVGIIAITAFGSIATAVQAVRAGAHDFVPKPFEPAEMTLRIQRAIEENRVRRELVALRTEVEGRFSVGAIIGASRATERVVNLVRRVAPTDVTVLVSGATGTGKEVVARAIHGESARARGPFVCVNCAALPPQLLEAELFGVVRGAFTGADRDRPGLFQTAKGGTLFLDEIGELAPELQPKLLRALAEREVRRLGATVDEAIDVRIVAATCRPLVDAIEHNRFREDLYYRLAVVTIDLVPLRDRVEEIMPLAEHFLRRASARSGRRIRGFSPGAAERMCEHDWPGNARELENAVQRAVALCPGELIEAEHVFDRAAPARTLVDAAAERQLPLADLERQYAERILRSVGGNKKRAAEILGIDRRTLQRWFGGDDKG